ncbi:unnamed protein product (macronuclear) [Paramecium tetraurelia]|uniref:Uncharacterized protein n=1 Tax=Paramecium tetraurelia TaxID=5888 RepID=A0BL06_PARTE|nr:uncharacterized protein GSPATT00029854001 [Paramecium tetraurelia]CAK59223.1 unnamed protein product [Paramecium tetraurelia]|eukprot:XP_001426621.1 hypothetical protein (macronuclear) [Paramecium tetraurelia strain d4-2]
MSQSSDKRMCKTHNLQIIATNLKESCDEESRHLCGQCLTLRTMEQTIHINEVAQNYLNEIKTEYYQQKSKNIEQAQNILSQLQVCIDELKRSLLQICEKVSQQITQEIERLSSLMEKLDQTVQSIDVYNFDELFTKLSKRRFRKFIVFIQKHLKISDRTNLEQLKNRRISSITQFNRILNKSNGNLLNSIMLVELRRTLDCKDYNDNKQDTPGLKVVCQTHNKEVIAFDLDPERAKENRLACIYCIEENSIKYHSLTKVQKQWNQLEEIKKKKLEALQQKNYENEQVILQQLTTFTDILQQKKNEIIDYLKEHNSNLNNIINSAFQGQNQNWQNFQKKTLLDIAETLSNTQLTDQIQFKQENQILEQEQQLNKNIYNSLQKVKETCATSFQKISEKICNDQEQVFYHSMIQQQREPQMISKVVELNLQIPQETKYQEIKQTQTDSVSQGQAKINYLMLQNPPIRQVDNFRSLCFTKENDILIAGCNKSIQLYKFIWGQLELIQSLDKHDSNICSIYAMKKSKSFVSGDFNGKVIFWVFEDNKLKFQAELKEHTDYVNQILMNKDENEMITCSDDKCIKFYTKEQQQWRCVQTIKNHQSNVNAISLNALENTLISCGFDSLISVLIKDPLLREWQVKQTIKNEQYGYRICFIKNNHFFFQPQGQSKIQLFKKSSVSGEFEKMNEFDVTKIQSSCCRWFQMEYKEQSKLLLCKNGNCVNLFKVQDDYSLKAEQTITFETQSIYGAITSDSLYLILWDEKSKQFQIRKQYDE